MNNFSLKNRFFQLKQAVSLSSSLTRLSKIGASSLMLAGAIVSPALADPVPPPPEPEFPPLPTVFCFRFTDIKQSTTDSNRFEFEFESLNWSNQLTYEVKIAFNQATKGKTNQAPVLDGAGVDSNGRPIGADSARPPGNKDIANDWTAQSFANDPSDPSKKTAVSWKAGTPISNIDLIGIQNSLPGGTTQDIINRVNQNFDFNPDFNPATDLETIDNGPNVRDGFVFALDDFDEGEVASFNWFLRDQNGQDIGQPNQGNAYGFGTINLTRIAPGSSTLPGGVITGNTGFSQAANLFYPDIFKVKDEDGNIVAEFGAEFGAGIAAPFSFADDNDNGVVPNAKVVPEPMTMLGTFAAFGFGAYFKRTGSKKHKLLNSESDS